MPKKPKIASALSPSPSNDHHRVANADGKQDEERRSKQVEERAEAARKRTQTYVTERSRNRDKEMRRLYDHHRVPDADGKQDFINSTAFPPP